MCAALALALVAPDAGAQWKCAYESKYFREVGGIGFEGLAPLLIAAIGHVDTDPAGRLLVTDYPGHQVLLFDSTGYLQASVNSEICHPGLSFSPLSAHFVGDRSIIVLTSTSGMGVSLCVGRGL